MIFGDINTLFIGKAKGSGQKLVGWDGQTNEIFGDTWEIVDRARGGNDTLVGGAGHGTANKLVGDAARIMGEGRGGDDTFIAAGDWTQNTFFGDAHSSLRDNARGGDDTFAASAGQFVSHVYYGDAHSISGTARGGNDRMDVSLGDSSYAELIGDAEFIAASARGGNDTIRVEVVGWSNNAIAYGDARHLEGKGGDDRITFSGGDGGGEGQGGAYLLGDASHMASTAKGGNDTLVGGAETSHLMGEGYFMSAGAVGGDDRLVSGTWSDMMYGDAMGMAAGAIGGRDTFVFAPGGGIDFIYDFEHGKDLIDLTAYASAGVHGLADLILTDSGTPDPGGVFTAWIGLPADAVAVRTTEVMTERDFIFA